MGSLLLPDLRVDSRRGLPPGKAGRVEPRETQLARLKRMSAAGVAAGASGGLDGWWGFLGGPHPASVSWS